MKFVKSIGICLLLLLIFGSSFSKAEACAKCAIPNFEESKTRATAIFVGKMLSISRMMRQKYLNFKYQKLEKNNIENC